MADQGQGRGCWVVVVALLLLVVGGAVFAHYQVKKAVVDGLYQMLLAPGPIAGSGEEDRAEVLDSVDLGPQRADGSAAEAHGDAGAQQVGRGDPRTARDRQEAHPARQRHEVPHHDTHS